MYDPSSKSVDDNDTFALLIGERKNKLLDTNILDFALCIRPECREHRYTREMCKLSWDCKQAPNTQN